MRRLLKTYRVHGVWVIVICWFFSVTSYGLAYNLPELPYYPGANIQFDIQRGVVDAMPFQSYLFSYRGSIEELEDFYQQSWQSVGRVVKRRVGEDVELSVANEQYFWNLKYRLLSGQYQGSVTVSVKPDLVLDQRQAYRQSTTISLPSDITIRQRSEIDDGRQKMEILNCHSYQRLEHNRSIVHSILIRDGWKAAHISNDERRANHEYVRGDLQLGLYFTEDNQSETMIMVRMIGH